MLKVPDPKELKDFDIRNYEVPMFELKHKENIIKIIENAEETEELALEQMD